jgi:hypothetical protein
MRWNTANFAPFALIILILSQGCGGGDSPTTPTTPTPTNITGTYTLQSVNGQSLPYVLVVETAHVYGWTLTAGSTTLNQDMTASSSATVTVTDSGTSSTTTVTDIGTYTHTNGAITVTWASSTPDSGSIVGSKLTLTDDGDVYIFQK